MVFGQAVEVALSQSKMIDTKALTSALEHLANRET